MMIIIIVGVVAVIVVCWLMVDGVEFVVLVCRGQ